MWSIFKPLFSEYGNGTLPRRAVHAAGFRFLAHVDALHAVGQQMGARFIEMIHAF